MPALQSLPDLSNVAQANPFVSDAIMNQVGLANQFNAAGAERNAADLQGINLQNQFDQQNMATKLGQSQATLADTIAGTQGKQFTNRINAGTEQEQMAAKRAEMLQKASTAELTALSDKGQRLIYQGAESGDQSLIDKGNRMMSASWEAQQTKQKQEAEIEKARVTGTSRETVANINQNGANERNQRDNETRRAQAEARRGSLDDFIMKAPTVEAKAANATLAAQKSMQAGDIDNYQRYTQLAQQYGEQSAQNIKNKGLATPGIDVSQVAGMPPKPQPSSNPALYQPQGQAGGDNPLASSDPMLQQWEGTKEQVQAAIAQLPPEARARAVQQYLAQEGRKTAATPTPAASTGSVRMRKPDGTLMNVPAANADKAAAAGWKKE